MRLAFLPVAALAFASCASKPAATPEYFAEIEQWRTDRATRLKAEDGWLTLIGLHWIQEGTNTIGSGPNSVVPMPPALPPRVGTITLKDKEARFTPAPGVPLKPTLLHDDNQPNYETLQLGTVRFYLIERGGRFGIRVKDTASPARTHFTGLEYFPTDPTWNVTATLTPAPHDVTFDTEVGVQQHDDSPGYLEFDRDGVHYKLDAVQEEDELFLVIRDATSGKTTYGASRFLYAKLPDAQGPNQGMVRLDFNKAYNPPCVFTAFATCPLPPMQNRLKTPIEAGEKKYNGPTATP